ncbi:tyrosine--tRNA ligase [Tuwongella immobilis]|uniref:Tyrosine--tRNA ligase n=1 Tax=Tuwongella immobilis TaxID=692036 RepID=A0A6C2YVU0_9BACT|nr:tyrosine--tRNA ligase [Tuwongella immobilis]VIP04982.1 tyrosyl-trna synthetase : Tyrosine--tRNA ligase OS=Isosphaera pallida (strain ATCC 43644 / DSM 9630 / IS1B) GN=tyrS PE=3 SV=1: tRNA-synt_1b [Tuwongella immobilis]VTS07322.1 tyrosyl-trna synthetase : Tyrosine--tRNA ligase OS=Isosphaera pallida (strain ATCC 43644 / DSM 9630 / IS1B) GN=tyrS PE=3 SV=1: tRNA-synt_1b [Tuwongella immobilis]
MAMLSVEEQLERIQRGADQIEPFADFKRKLERSVATGKPLRIKYGIDPTGIDVHLGHTVPLRKLRLFQELGHQAVLIIGNYTALVGDPSGRDQTRARLTQEQVEANAQDYLKQVAKVIDIERTEVRYNGEWFGKYSFLDVLSLTSKITIQRMLERDDFTKRFRSEPSIPIYLHECLYPLMQGQDSVDIQADVELGGSEQLFNLMMGRRLQQEAGQEPQICLTLPILRGLDGIRRMGKSLGNYVGVGEPAQVQFDKTMSLPDEPMREWFELLTDRPGEEIATLLDSAQTRPIDAKKRLGMDIVTFYHGAEVAEQVRGEWERRFSGKQDPTEIPEVTIPQADIVDGSVMASKLLTLTGMVKSNKEGRQKIVEGAVNIGPERVKVTDPVAMIPIVDGMIVRLGSKTIRRIRLGS